MLTLWTLKELEYKIFSHRETEIISGNVFYKEYCSIIIFNSNELLLVVDHEFDLNNGYSQFFEQVQLNLASLFACQNFWLTWPQEIHLVTGLLLPLNEASIRLLIGLFHIVNNLYNL